MRQRSDEQLALLVINGDQSAFAILVERYQKQVLNLAYRLCGDYDSAQDLAQESFLRIYNELPHYDTTRRFFPWMYKVAQNTCLNHISQRKQENVPLDDVFDLESDDRSGNPDASFSRLEQGEAVRLALTRLPERYRVPLALKYLNELSYQQISEQLGLPVSTIETRLHRGRAMLKDLLADYL